MEHERWKLAARGARETSGARNPRLAKFLPWRNAGDFRQWDCVHADPDPSGALRDLLFYFFFFF